MPSLCEFMTADGQPLHGLLYQATDPDERAVLLAHGVGGAFYTRPYPQLAEALRGHGFTVLAANTRGHDWVTRGPDGAPSAGATFEVISDCLLDLDAGLACLAEAGFRRFVVMGHSLGAVKAAFYQGTRQRADVAAVVCCSAPKLFYSTRVTEQPDFAEKMVRAQAMLAEGRGSDLFPATAGSGPGLFSARTYVDKYGPEEHTDLRRLAGSLGAPLFTLAGSAEFTASFVPYAQELAALAQGACEIVEGAPTATPATSRTSRNSSPTGCGRARRRAAPSGAPGRAAAWLAGSAPGLGSARRHRGSSARAARRRS